VEGIKELVLFTRMTSKLAMPGACLYIIPAILSTDTTGTNSSNYHRRRYYYLYAAVKVVTEYGTTIDRISRRHDEETRLN